MPILSEKAMYTQPHDSLLTNISIRHDTAKEMIGAFCILFSLGLVTIVQ